MPLAMDVGLDLCDVALDGDPAAPTERGTAVTRFSGHSLSIVAKRSPISVTVELLLPPAS